MYQQIYYGGVFGLSVLLTLLYTFQWRKRFDTYMTSIFILVPVATLAYLLMYSSGNAETVAAVLKVAYVGGCFLPWLTTLCVCRLCQVEFGRGLRTLTFMLSTAVYLGVLTIGHSDLFYKSLAIERLDTGWIQHKVYGPLHTVHYAVIALYLVVNLAVIIYSFRKQHQVSRRVLTLLFIPVPITAFGYYANHFLTQTGFESTPLLYVIAQLIYLLISQRMILYNVSDLAIESEIQSGDMGFASFDTEYRYLGSNDKAKKILPPLSGMSVDKSIRSCASLNDTAIRWLTQFDENPEHAAHMYQISDENDPPEDRIYTVKVRYLDDGRKHCGYQLLFRDDTQNQKYIRLLDRYNSDLQADVEAKTNRIIAMHDRLVLGMATMVESRDNSTGGHIKRTSEGVRMLINEMRKDESLKLSDDFCTDIIKAAPMHDLGKITVDDAVLRKPGRYTPEDYEKMKLHAAEGAKIVHNILEDTDDEEFRRIAENVAHYHHERMDGSGYPDGLKGEEIPLEARIMAIADVYDALVSKRVYKESYSFEKANSIILEGMGSQFDPALKPYYEAARPNLEAYYAANM